MRFRKFAATAVALSIGASGAAFGQGNGRMEDYPQWQQGTDRQIREQGGIARASQLPPQRGQGDQRGDNRGYQGDQRGDNRAYHGDQRGDNRGYYQGDGYRYGGYRDAHDRGAGPDHSWYRGDRLPSSYRGRQYVVDDWRGHHLSAPPSGYHWVQAGGDYVLAAIATGVIATILLNQ